MFLDSLWPMTLQNTIHMTCIKNSVYTVSWLQRYNLLGSALLIREVKEALKFKSSENVKISFPVVLIIYKNNMPDIPVQHLDKALLFTRLLRISLKSYNEI